MITLTKPLEFYHLNADINRWFWQIPLLKCKSDPRPANLSVRYILQVRGGGMNQVCRGPVSSLRCLICSHMMDVVSLSWLLIRRRNVSYVNTLRQAANWLLHPLVITWPQSLLKEVKAADAHWSRGVTGGSCNPNQVKGEDFWEGSALGPNVEKWTEKHWRSIAAHPTHLLTAWRKEKQEDLFASVLQQISVTWRG